jgi:hypothetical protein
MDRCTTAARCLVGKERVAMRRGKTGAELPAIICDAGIMSSRPAKIEAPGAIATKASRSMMIPNERLCRLCISQSRVKWSVGTSSCSRCIRRRQESARSRRQAVSALKKASWRNDWLLVRIRALGRIALTGSVKSPLDSCRFHWGRLVMVQSAARVKPNGDLASVEAGPYALIAHMDGRRLFVPFSLRSFGP